MNRRDFLQLTALGTAAASLSPEMDAAASPLTLEEASITQLQQTMAAGRESAVSLVRHYQRRIARIDRRGPALNSVIELNPDAVTIARTLDVERRAGHLRGPLHGIPILIKDNIDTHDRMSTTAGSLALRGSIPPGDSFVAKKLRDAGAVILGKTNLSEWANIRSTRSTSGWSGRGGLTRNPYVLDRNTSGSSSGSGAAVSACLCAAAIGTETDGSIVSPASFCGIVGIKPTVGLISRAGIIPIAQSQDTAGPMARSVADAAILLTALTGRDPRDSARPVPREIPVGLDYTQFLTIGSLKGARLGVARKFFGITPEADRAMEGALAVLRTRGAVLIDPVDLPTSTAYGDAETEVLLCELKAGLNDYLASLGSAAPAKTLAQIIEFNEQNKATEMPWFGQENFLRAQEKGPLTDPAYLEARKKCVRLARTEGIDAFLSKHQLDAFIAPTTGPAHRTDLVYGDRDTGGSSSPAAVAGYPSITVPAGYVSELPVGISFFGPAWSEGKLIGFAHEFEQFSRARRMPRFLASVG